MSQVVMARKARAMQLATLKNSKNTPASSESKNYSGNYSGYLEKKTRCCAETVKGVGGNKKSSENHLVARERECAGNVKSRTYTSVTYEKKLDNVSSSSDICKVGNRVVGRSYALVGNPVTRTRCEVVRTQRTMTSGDRIRDLKNKAIMENR